MHINDMKTLCKMKIIFKNTKNAERRQKIEQDFTAGSVDV